MEEKIDKEKTDKITNVNISSEVKSSFLDYSMSVIVSRAIPDVRDGLKPVHRRILYTMFEEGMHPNRKHQKCANAVGAIMGHYHPHGDSAIYESMVRMAQDFTYRHTLVDGHGNFGSIDGDSAAAYRYTEARLSKISMELLRDITKETVDFRTNYDGQREEPEVLPSKFPNILVNGNMGIAVGMATNIPPHNLGEVIDGCVTYIDNPEISVVELMEHIKGPDFPTAATILGDVGIRQAYQTGKGSLTIESTVNIEEKKGKEYLIIKEIPYQVNKTSLITKIAELVSEKQIKGLTNLEDESALEGIRIVIEVKKGYNANVLLNNLYKLTQLQTRYHINFLMLVNGKPQTLGLIPILDNYLQYQKTIIIRRTKYDLNKFEKREHILKGLIIALNNIDEIIKIIKQSRTTDEIKKQFNEKYGLTEKQSIAILEMQLRRLSGLEREKIENELESISNLIKELKKILASDAKVLEIIKEELLEIKEKYATPRKTIIDNVSPEFIEDESLIPDEDVVITLTHKGYIKRITLETYKTQSRGGVGVKGMGTNEEDFVENLIYMTTHDYLMFFTNKGKTYRVKGYDVPVQLRQSKGLPIVNLLPLDEDETVKTMLKVSQDEESKYCLFCTEKGLVKRTKLEEFEKVRSSGKIAITLREGDSLIAVKKTTGNDQIIIASNNGKLIHIDEKEVSVSGRVAQGSIGIRMREGVVIGCEITEKGQKVLVVTENGYGKKTEIEKYRIIHRGGRGVKTLNKTPRTGDIVSIKTVDDDNSEDLMIVTNNGIIIRLPVEQVSHNDRVAHGARLIRLKEDQKVSTVTTIKNSIDEESS